MSIQLLSIHHKTAPLEIRSRFAFEEESQRQLMLSLKEQIWIQETVVIATCNRTELYVYATEDSDSRQVFEWMKRAVLEQADALDVTDIGNYLRLYQEDKAVHHLFLVAAGLDSMIIGEDQILGQVKRAHEHSMQYHLCGPYLNTLFRMAVTSAKKVKTKTELSKTPVSTASLALKAAEQKLGTLKGKKLMIIGATGKIGGIVLKNAASMPGLLVYATMRTHSLVEEAGCHRPYQVIAYEERYAYLDEMDIVISATKSPHFTLTKYKMQKVLKTKKKRVLIDLAVPMDIEGDMQAPGEVISYNIEDFRHLAKKNNDKKKQEAKSAGIILEDYEGQFQKWLLFQQSMPLMKGLKDYLVVKAEEKGLDHAIEKLFYDIRNDCSAEELEGFLKAVENVVASSEFILHSEEQ